MIQTLLIYILLLIVMVYMTSLSATYNEKEGTYAFRNFFNGPVLLTIILFSVIFGMRYNVGVDHLSYMKDYEELRLYNNISDKRTEPAFNLISDIFSGLSLHYTFFFAFLAFLQISFMFLAFRKYRDVLPFVMLTFMLECVFLTFMNVMRQEIAFCIFMCSLEFIRSKKPLPYFLLITLAFLFHKSAILLYPVYFFFQRKDFYFKNIKLELILLTGALLIMLINVFGEIFASMDILMNILGYNKYIDAVNMDNSLLFSLNRERGLGFYLVLLLDIILISNSNQVKDYFKGTLFPMIYDLYFIGVIYGYITNGSIILSRPNYYFAGFEFIVTAFSMLYYFRKMMESTKNRWLFFTLLGINLMIFAAYMFRMKDNMALFTFFWQV